jgi:transposase
MRSIKEIVRQRLLLNRSHRAIAKSVGVAVGTVGGTLSRCRAAGLLDDVTRVESMREDELEALLYAKTTVSTRSVAEPDCAHIHRELLRAGVTLLLLHSEYLEANGGGLGYTAFCARYRGWLKTSRVTLRQEHRAGEKLFVDYSGKRPEIIDPATGEVTKVELFVAVLGASNFSYAEATLTQQGHDWIASHVRALKFMGGAPKAIVCDQLKSGVSKACRYEPQAQRTYEELAKYYATCVLPARPRKPRDKAKVEGAVLIVQRWILAAIRNEKFFSLQALNERIRALLGVLNSKLMRRYKKSRQALFEEVERGCLTPLPEADFEHADFKKVRVNIDYHVAFEGHLYSVPFKHARQEVELRVTRSLVEVLLRGEVIAMHRRSAREGGYTTVPEHMPSAHRAHVEWSPQRLLNWAASVGAETQNLCARILETRPHPEQGYRSCLGILRLAKRYGEARLERACARANGVHARTYKHVESILKNNLDAVSPAASVPPSRTPIAHENVRGPGHFTVH